MIPSLAFPSSNQQQARHQREDSMSTQAQSQRRMSVSDVVISKNGRGYLKSRSSESGSLSNERSNGSSSESTARHGRRGNSQDVGSNEIYSSSLAPPGARNGDVIQISERDHRSGETPYSRGPELRVSHKLAERKRRKEMKELFDELREHLPADRRMKASKWEILTKAVEYITQLKQAYDDCQVELDELKCESNVDSARHSDREEDLAPHSIPRSEHIIYSSYRHPSSSGQRTEPIARQASLYDDSSRSSATPSPLGQIHSPSRQTHSD